MPELRDQSAALDRIRPQPLPEAPRFPRPSSEAETSTNDKENPIHTRRSLIRERLSSESFPEVGYDIAVGSLNAQNRNHPKLTEEEIEDTARFRRCNRKECVSERSHIYIGPTINTGIFYHPQSSDQQQTDTTGSAPSQNTSADTEPPCQPAYRLDSRLFPRHNAALSHAAHASSLPSSGGITCVDEDPLKKFVRVSIPRSVLDESAKLKASLQATHNPDQPRTRVGSQSLSKQANQKMAKGPTRGPQQRATAANSFSLRAHCNAGWEVARPFIGAGPASIALAPSLHERTARGSLQAGAVLEDVLALSQQLR